MIVVIAVSAAHAIVGPVTACGSRHGRWAGIAVTLACALTMPAISGAAPLPYPAVAQVTETGGSAYLTSLPDLPFSPSSPTGLPLITVNTSKSFQTVNGFGAALTDSSAWLIGEQLAPATRERLLNDLFGAEGLDLGFLRLPIGASDFTAHGRPYSYDDLRRGQRDPHLRQFSISHDRAYVIPTVRKAVSIHPNIEILATPWSAPPWMKANHQFNNAAGLGTLLRSSYRPLAEYFVRFLRAYASSGIRVTAISPQNEPQGQSLFPGLNLSWRNEAMWIMRYLRPALRAAGLRTKVYAADVGWAGATYQDDLARTRAARALSGVAWHCYGGSPAVMQQLHALAPRLDQIVSECATQITPYTVPEVIIASLRYWASTVALWNLALNRSGGPVQPPNSGCAGCRGLVTVDPWTHTVHYNLAYYQLGQFSRFISRGATRVESTQPDGIDDVAVRNPDGSVAVVVYNQSGSTATFAIAWDHRYLRLALPSGATASFRWAGS